MSGAGNNQADLVTTNDYIRQQDVEKSRIAARLAHQILDEILAHIKPGMRESEVKNFAEQRYAAHGIERPWHMPYIRFGENTLLTFRNKAKEDLVLRDEDIAFADIGTVKNGIEGDAGRTVSFGSNKIYDALRDASEQIFHDAVAYWREHRPTGIALYEHVLGLTAKTGFVFNLEPAGHLIGQFPHRGWKRGLNIFPEIAANGVWVLEVQLRHPTLPYGAFFEDLLIDE